MYQDAWHVGVQTCSQMILLLLCQMGIKGLCKVKKITTLARLWQLILLVLEQPQTFCSS